MSVLIKGMKMPSCCYECDFREWSNLHQTMACKRDDFKSCKPCFEDNSREFYKKRADFCPLVEVPAPHGRLIDADALMKKCQNPYHGIRQWVEDLDIVKASTIIEAEGTK